MKKKQRTYLGLRGVFIKHFLRGSVKCLPYLGNLLDEIIFGVLDDESARAESEKIHNKLDKIIKGQDQQEADFAEILLALHIQTDVNETIKVKLKGIEQSIRDTKDSPFPEYFGKALDNVIGGNKEIHAELQKLAEQQKLEHKRQSLEHKQIEEKVDGIEGDVKELIEKVDLANDSGTTIKDHAKVGSMGNGGTVVEGDQIIHIHPPSSGKSHDPESRKIGRTKVRVLIDEDYYKFKKSQREGFVFAVSSMLQVEPYEIIIHKVKPGSTILTLEMPAEAAERFVSMYLQGENIIAQLKIKKVAIEDKAELESTTAGKIETTRNGGEFDVFLSHNSKNKPIVKTLAKELKKRGLKVWLDEWELVPGRPWQEAIEEIIQTTRTAAVLVGKDGMGPWEIPEMRACLSEFVRRKLPVIPVLLPEASIKPALPLFLRLFTWVDLRKGLTKEGLDRVEWGIRGKRTSVKVATKPSHINNIPFKSIGDLFKGRGKDFDKLKDQLGDKSQATAITQEQKDRPEAIYGLGGIGKTRLAVEFGWCALEQLGYKAVLFVNCGQELYDQDQRSDPQQQKREKSAVERLYAEMAKLASAELLDIQGSDAMLPEAAYHEVIKQLQRREDWLIVFDNVDANDICNAMKATLPKLKGGKVIITSRLANWTGDIKPLELKKLSPDASIDYLLQKTEDKRPSGDNDSEKVKELAQKLDGLPVALEQAAAYII
ncbi:MAG: toll/interleukin-1 receptor domain-containing protein, partial [Planctomycetota bacterium]